MAHICICDDEEGILKYLKKVLKGHRVETFSRGSELLARLEAPGAGDLDLLLQDLRMPDLDGLQIMKTVSRVRPELPVIIMTAFATVDDAVQAIKLGAYDYLTKPFPNEKLLSMVDNILQMRRLADENRRLREEISGGGQEQIVFASPRF